MSKYCTECGTERSTEAKFCVICGNKNIQRESDKKKPKKTVDKKATMADEKTRLNQLTEKIRGWKKEGYKVDELESKIKDIEIQTPHIEAKPSIPPIREPKYGYALGVIALFVILAVIAGGIYGVYLDSIDNGYTETDIYEYDEDEVILGDSDGDGVDDDNDAFPYDSSEWKDSDNDGVGDNSDAFPNNPDEQYDYDGDGIGDTADQDDDNDGYFDSEDYLPYEDAEIQIDLIKFIVWDEVDGWPDDNTKAQIYFEIHINDVKVARSPQEGYVWNADIGITETINWDFTFNIPDNSQMHSISIRMYDSDAIFNDQLDIDGHDDTRGCTITYNIVAETWSGDDSDGVTDGSYDGTQYSDDDDAYLTYDISTV